MSITDEQKEYIQLVAKTTAQETVDKCIVKLPCKEHANKIDDHNKILHDGLKQTTERLEKEVKRLNEREEKRETEKRTGRQAFWRAFIIGIGVSGFGAILGMLITHFVGG